MKVHRMGPDVAHRGCRMNRYDSDIEPVRGCAMKRREVLSLAAGATVWPFAARAQRAIPKAGGDADVVAAKKIDPDLVE